MTNLRVGSTLLLNVSLGTVKSCIIFLVYLKVVMSKIRTSCAIKNQCL